MGEAEGAQISSISGPVQLLGDRHAGRPVRHQGGMTCDAEADVPGPRTSQEVGARYFQTAPRLSLRSTRERGQGEEIHAYVDADGRVAGGLGGVQAEAC